MAHCESCGRCCHWTDVNGKKHKCKFLVRLSKTRTVCRIYSKRLGTIIAKDGDKLIGCAMRSQSAFNYPGCPMNEDYPDKPIFKE